MILCILFGHNPLRTKPAIVAFRDSAAIPNGDIHACKRCHTLVFEANDEVIVTKYGVQVVEDRDAVA